MVVLSVVWPWILGLPNDSSDIWVEIPSISTGSVNTVGHLGITVIAPLMIIINSRSAVNDRRGILRVAWSDIRLIASVNGVVSYVPLSTAVHVHSGERSHVILLWQVVVVSLFGQVVYSGRGGKAHTN